MPHAALREILLTYGEIGAYFLDLACAAVTKPPSCLADIHSQILACQQCRLHERRRQSVPGEGTSQPEVVFIGEAPGEKEDELGRPFVGNAGQLLERIIARMGFSRPEVFITNVVKCRPPANREPLRDEVDACLPFLHGQLALLRPRVIVCLGKTALNHLLNASFNITRVRGQTFHWQDVPVIPTYHPAFILHKKDKEEITRAKWEVWEDMKTVLHLLGRSTS